MEKQPKSRVLRGRADEKRQTTEAQDVYGTRLRLTRDGLAYGEEFVAFDEINDKQPVSPNIWNPATNLFEVTVYRRHGAPLVVKNLPLRTADRLRNTIIDTLRERRS
ncbi:MAG TPA: hypothetical protein VK357_06915 [Rubrobacteraceae bacterium]|nr:hypothetical protein [Rubrobacteraceae bacterium]